MYYPLLLGMIRLAFSNDPSSLATCQPVVLFSDECASAPLVACNQEFTINNRAATSNPSDPVFACDIPNQRTGGGTVWFRFTAIAASAVVTTRNTQLPVEHAAIAVFTMTGVSPCTTLALVGCDSDGTDDSYLSEVSLNGLTIGQDYLVEIASFLKQDQGENKVGLNCPPLAEPTGGCLYSNGTCQVKTLSQCLDTDGYYTGDGTTCDATPCPTRPANDACAAAQPITMLGVPVAANNFCATDDVPLTLLCPQSDIPGNRTLWYTVPGTGARLEATTCHGLTGTETVLAVLCGPCTDLHCVDIQNDPNGDCFNQYMSTVRWCSQPGVTYHIVVGTLGTGGSPGPIYLTVNECGVCETPSSCCRADYDRDTHVTSTDFFLFLDAFFVSNADFNRDGTTNSQDFFEFLAHFQTGC